MSSVFINSRAMSIKEKIIKLLILFTLVFGFFAYATEESHEAKAYYNSLLELESTRSDIAGIGSSISAFFSAMETIFSVLFNCYKEVVSLPLLDAFNTCLPYEIGNRPDMKPTMADQCAGFEPGPADDAASAALAIAHYYIWLWTMEQLIVAGLAIPIIGLALIFFAVVEIMYVVEFCMGHYTVSPPEYLMLFGNGTPGGKNPDGFGPNAPAVKANDFTCVNSSFDGSLMFDPTKSPFVGNDPNNVEYLTYAEVPFFYTCECPGDPPCRGYMGNASALCSSKTAENRAMPKLVHSITIGRLDDIMRDICQTSKDSFFTIWPGDKRTSPAKVDYTLPLVDIHMTVDVRGFYRMSNGKLQLCAYADHWSLPTEIVVGCTYITPPYEDVFINSTIKDFVEKSRCKYILPNKTRDDLAAVADTLENKNYSSVYLFLKSDWHMMSTIFGCLQDLLIDIMLLPVDTGEGQEKDSFLTQVQDGMRGIVMAVLVLYVSLVGIKIISSPELPKKSEWMMYILKFAFVLYFGLGDVWYDGKDTDGDPNKATGLYPSIVGSMQEIIDLFMQAQSKSNPLEMCYQVDPSVGGDVNILSQHKVRVDGVKDPIQMTVWDYLDCVLINYLNASTCNYSSTGLIFIWLIPTCLFCPSGILTLIAMLIYAIMILLVIFKFFHIVILTLFMVTLLVLIAPIIMCFFLFDFTKDITIQWFKMLLGYTLYPGLLFVFLALMLASLDSIFYGFTADQIPDKLKQCWQTGQNCDYKITSQDVIAMCGNGDETPEEHSTFCALMQNHIGMQDLRGCSITGGRQLSVLVEYRHNWLIGDYVCLNGKLSMSIFNSLMLLALVALLFAMFIDSAINLISGMLYLPGLGNYAVLGSAIGGAGKAVTDKIGDVGGAALKKLASGK